MRGTAPAPRLRLGARSTTGRLAAMTIAVTVLVAAAVTGVAAQECREYWQAGCTGAVKATYSQLARIAIHPPPDCDEENDRIAFCVAQPNRIALTHVEKSCHPSYGSVFTAGVCEKGASVSGQGRWYNCSDTHGECRGDTVPPVCRRVPASVGTITISHSCSADYQTMLYADGSCQSLGEYGGAMRLSCLSDKHMEASMFTDDACTTPMEDPSPMLLAKGGQCYNVGGTQKTMEITVTSGCDCGAPGKVDLVFIWVASDVASGSLDTDALAAALSSTTNLPVVVSATPLVGGHLNITVRFKGVAASGVARFNADINTAVGDGTYQRMLADAGLVAGGGAALPALSNINAASGGTEEPYLQPPDNAARRTAAAGGPAAATVALVVALVAAARGL